MIMLNLTLLVKLHCLYLFQSILSYASRKLDFFDREWLIIGDYLNKSLYSSEHKLFIRCYNIALRNEGLFRAFHDLVSKRSTKFGGFIKTDRVALKYAHELIQEILDNPKSKISLSPDISQEKVKIHSDNRRYDIWISRDETGMPVFIFVFKLMLISDLQHFPDSYVFTFDRDEDIKISGHGAFQIEKLKGITTKLLSHDTDN